MGDGAKKFKKLKVIECKSWTTVEPKKCKKKKVILDMIRNVAKSNKKVGTLEGFINEVWVDSIGLTYACTPCGRFFWRL